MYLIFSYNMALDYWVARDGIAEGLAIILDMDGTKLSHLTKVNIASMRKFLFYVQVFKFSLFLIILGFNPFFSSYHRKHCRFVCERFISLTFHRGWINC